MLDLKNIWEKKNPCPMKPEAYSSGTKAKYEWSMYSTQTIRWVSTELDEKGNPTKIRMPVESSKKYPYPGRFIAAGKPYEKWEQLYHQDTDILGIYKDIYGRRVYYCAERFPCFDSDDYLYEKRKYRWFFILGENKITRVFYTDGSNQINVTEDVANIENDCWKDIRRLPFWSPGNGAGSNEK